MYRQNTCSYQNNLVIAVLQLFIILLWPIKEVSSACQNKVNKSLPVVRNKAPAPVKGLNCFFSFIMNFVISLWSSQTWSCFGLGMKDKPFLSSFTWVVVNIVSLVMITTWLHSMGSDEGSTENSLDSVQDSANDSHRLLILSLEFCLCLFLLQFFLFLVSSSSSCSS